MLRHGLGLAALLPALGLALMSLVIALRVTLEIALRVALLRALRINSCKFWNSSGPAPSSRAAGGMRVASFMMFSPGGFLRVVFRVSRPALADKACGIDTVRGRRARGRRHYAGARGRRR